VKTSVCNCSTALPERKKDEIIKKKKKKKRKKEKKEKKYVKNRSVSHSLQTELFWRAKT